MAGGELKSDRGVSSNRRGDWTKRSAAGVIKRLPFHPSTGPATRCEGNVRQRQPYSDESRDSESALRQMHAQLTTGSGRLTGENVRNGCNQILCDWCPCDACAIENARRKGFVRDLIAENVSEDPKPISQSKVPLKFRFIQTQESQQPDEGKRTFTTKPAEWMELERYSML